jgi:hypothetical protein
MNRREWLATVTDPDCDADTLYAATRRNLHRPAILLAVAQHPHAPPEALWLAGIYGTWAVRDAAIEHPNTPDGLLWFLVEEANDSPEAATTLAAAWHRLTTWYRRLYT